MKKGQGRREPEERTEHEVRRRRLERVSVALAFEGWMSRRV